MPDAEIEPGEPNPGGVDALPEDDRTTSRPTSDRTTNPAVEESPDPLKKVPPRARTPTTEATKSDDGTRRGRRRRDEESPA